jgi:endogenous inhibitor of DNA gyrase (YacG/DUF329 family)
MKNNEKIPAGCIIKYGQDEYPFQEFNGKRYHLYTGERYYSRGTKRLHVTIYKFYYGAVPKGYHVHHKDENPLNNHPLNLEMMLGRDHLAYHMKDRDKEEMRKTMNYARTFADKWHGTEEGLAWHRAHAKNSLKKKEVHKICANCGKPFKTIAVNDKGHAKFCSDNCKNTSRFRSGVDNIETTCPICGKKKMRNKYSKSVTCGKSCGRKLLKQRKANSVSTP